MVKVLRRPVESAQRAAARVQLLRSTTAQLRRVALAHRAVLDDIEGRALSPTDVPQG